MERRNFIKLSALTGAMATLTSCGSPDHQLIRFIPDEDLIPGIATLKPSLCTLCSAGCGLQVRVMQGEAEVMRKGQLGLIKMGLAKKLEGNPQYPVNLGKLCPIGQAGVQVAYHPDRLRNPLKRKGQRGSGDFQEISWEDALKEVTAQLVSLRSSGSAASLAFLSRPLRGQRSELVEAFLKAFGAPSAVGYEPLDEAVLRQANLLSFGHAQLPTIDLGRADYVISFGADFLGTWNSPVSQSIGYGQMRQGRIGRRGRFAQVEARMSQTGASADDWVPCLPGSEGMLALGIAHVILHDKLYSGDGHPHAGSLIEGWAAGLPDYTPENIEKQTGVPAATITRLAHGMTDGGGLGTAFIGGPPLAHTNGLSSALAVNALAALMDAGKGASLLTFMPGTPFGNSKAPAAKVQGSFAALTALIQRSPKVLMSYEANPVFSAPASVGVRDAIAKVPYFVSFGSFLDETSILADLILPDNAPLESWLDNAPESGANVMVAGLAAPAVHPLYNTRAMPDVILDLARGLGGNVAAALPWKAFEDKLQAAFTPLRKQSSLSATSDDEFWSKVQDQGGWWSTPASGQAAKSGMPAGSAGHAPVKLMSAEFDGDASAFPFYFLPYASQAFRDGSVANLPWLQEMPDVISTAMWSSWIEINPKTAARLGIQQGDLVEITSPHGSLHAPAVFSPGVAPDMIAMPIGQGHENFTRYASGRGANPLSILGTLTEKETGSLAWAATRVKIARSGGAAQGKLVLFSGGLSRFPHPEEPR